MSLYNRLNRSNTPLEINGEYLGQGENTVKVGVLVSCHTDRASVLTLEWSPDNNNFDFTEELTVQANVPFNVHRRNLATYFRVRLVNGAIGAQTFLRLHSRFVDDVPEDVLEDINLKITACNTNSCNVAVTPIIGSHGNLWNNVNVASNVVSNTVDCQYVNNLCIFGNRSDGFNPMYINISQDNTNWYNTGTGIYANGDFYTTIQVPARYVRLETSNAAVDVVTTATLAGKSG